MKEQQSPFIHNLEKDEIDLIYARRLERMRQEMFQNNPRINPQDIIKYERENYKRIFLTDNERVWNSLSIDKNLDPSLPLWLARASMGLRAHELLNIFKIDWSRLNKFFPFVANTAWWLANKDMKLTQILIDKDRAVMQAGKVAPYQVWINQNIPFGKMGELETEEAMLARKVIKREVARSIYYMSFQWLKAQALDFPADLLNDYPQSNVNRSIDGFAYYEQMGEFSHIKRIDEINFTKIGLQIVFNEEKSNLYESEVYFRNPMNNPSRSCISDYE